MILSGLLAGALLAIMLGFDTKRFSFPSYLEQQQNIIKAFNVIMPLLGLAVIILTIVSAFSQKSNKPIFVSLLIAALLLIVSGLITRFGNQPINATVMTWSANAEPPNWSLLRDKWLNLHIIRTALSFFAFCMIGWCSLKK